MHPDRDPYAPPRRHRDFSGAIVRFLIIAVLLGAAAWGYLEFSQSPRTALVPTEEQSLADASADGGYQVETPDAELAQTGEATAPGAAPPS